MQRKLVERELTPEGPRRRAGVAPRRRSVTVNLAESPLGWLHAHGHLDDRLFFAGERLRADYERAQIAPGVTMRWEPVRLRGIHSNGSGRAGWRGEGMERATVIIAGHEGSRTKGLQG